MAEQKNGLEDYFVTKGNKKLRYGYTTGSCAAAAAKAATWMLLSQRKTEKIDLMTPRGILLHLLLEDICFDRKQASCAIRKDGGDDPDATDGLLVCAAVSKCEKTKEQQSKAEKSENSYEPYAAHAHSSDRVDHNKSGQ